MGTKIVVVLIAGVIVATCRIGKPLADEAVFCVSEENRYVVMIGSGDSCLEEETEMKISGSGIKTSGDLVPLANFAANSMCEESSAGTKADVGLDYNSNGRLEPEEILTTMSSCKPM